MAQLIDNSSFLKSHTSDYPQTCGKMLTEGY